MRLAALATLLVAAVATAPAAGAQQESAATAVSRALELVRRANSGAEAERADLYLAGLRALDAHPDLASNTWLREPLIGSSPDGQRAEARLASTLDLLSGERTRPDRTDRQRLERILADPRFKSFDLLSLLPPWLHPVAQLIEQVLRTLWNVVRWPVDRLLDLLVRGLTSGPIVLGLAALIIGALTLLYVRGLRSTLVGQTELSSEGGQLPPTAEEALRLAQERAARRAHREACHFLFLATLLWLEERGRFRFDASATNREHLTEVAEDPVLAVALRPFILRFDRVWYGQDDVSSGDYAELTALSERVRGALA